MEDDIYLIPLKIDECQIPERLAKFQWIKYDAASCFKLMLSSLNLQKQKYLDFEKKQIAARELFAFDEFEGKEEFGNSPKYVIDGRYFQFVDESHPSLNELNSIIKGKYVERVVNARNEFHEVSGHILDLGDLMLDWHYDISYATNLITKTIISINEKIG